LNKIFAQYANETCDVVLVGHDIQSDIQYLSRVGFETNQLPGLIGNIDTQSIYRAYKDDGQSRSLGYVLSQLGIAYKNLHNAGNDAVYTLRAMTAIGVEQLHPAQDTQSPEGPSQQ
jgi:DNA polymerase III alpha subunit (gram-positive type)